MADAQNVLAAPDSAPEKQPKKSVNNQDFEPPLSTVRKVIRSALPDGVKMSNDTVQACAKAAGIFVHYLTSCANDFCKENKRNTVSADDVLEALKELEFEELIEPLKAFLEQQKALRAEKAATKKAAAAMVETKSDEVAASAPTATTNDSESAMETAEEAENTSLTPKVGETAVDSMNQDGEEATMAPKRVEAALENNGDDLEKMDMNEAITSEDAVKVAASEDVEKNEDKKDEVAEMKSEDIERKRDEPEKSSEEVEEML